MTAKHRSAKVHWRIGQPLLPEHFHAQEESLRLERQRILESWGLPFYGVAELTWDEHRLRNGIVDIRSMLVFLRTGEILDLPGNTVLTQETFNLNEVNALEVTLYLLLESGPEIIGSERVGEDDEEGIERAVQRVTLSKEPYRDGCVASFEVAVFKKNADKSWSLAADWLPALVRLKGSPYFGAVLHRMRACATGFEQLLRDDIQEHFLSSETQLGARDALRCVYQFVALLSDLDRGGTDFHPYALYSALRELYIELCVYREVQPSFMNYDHANLFGAFEEMLGAIETQLAQKKLERPYQAFVLEGGLRHCELTAAAKRASTVFWIVQRPSASALVDVSGIKLASRSRIPIVHTHALRGVPFTVVPRPPFRHGFSSSVEFYALSPGREWDYAVGEGRLAFVDSPALEGARTYLYWRAEPEPGA